MGRGQQLVEGAVGQPDLNFEKQRVLGESGRFLIMVFLECYLGGGTCFRKGRLLGPTEKAPHCNRVEGFHPECPSEGLSRPSAPSTSPRAAIPQLTSPQWPGMFSFLTWQQFHLLP